MYTQIFGRNGENIAANFLKEKGFEIMEQNFRCRVGEIDIIAKDKEYIVFVEVKSRTSCKFGTPSESVIYSKQLKIKRTANLWLINNYDSEPYVRFDVIEVIDNQVTNHIENAF